MAAQPPVSKLELLDSILDGLDKVRYKDEPARDALMKRAAMLLRRICGEQSHYLVELGRIRFYPMYAPSTDEAQRSSWTNAAERVRNLVNTVKEEIELFEDNSRLSPALPTDTAASPTASVFVVHGHDEELKQSVARSLERLGLDPVILHERPNKGRTIIEKFDDYSKVGFAVVLLSADDIGRSTVESEDSYRPRQNVVFELGFFLGRLGRERVAAIFRPHEKFEMPSDYSGVLFIEYDSEGAWRYKLAKELKAVGIKINVEGIL